MLEAKARGFEIRDFFQSLFSPFSSKIQSFDRLNVFSFHVPKTSAKYFLVVVAVVAVVDGDVAATVVDAVSVVVVAVVVAC